VSEDHVDVIIVNYLTGDLARIAVEQIASPRTSIWVVDNSGELLDDPPPSAVLLGDGTNRMYAEASNLAYRSGTAELVLLLNPDVVIRPEQLAALADRLSRDGSLWGVAPTLSSPGVPPHGYLRRLPTVAGLVADLCPPLRTMLRGAYRRYRCRDLIESAGAAEMVIEQPAAACLLVRRSIVGAVLFDEGFPLFFNDTDLARRMAAFGRQCVVLQSVTVPHVGGASIDREKSRSGAWTADEYDRSALRYARRNLSGWAVIAPLIAVRYIARRLRRS
jgi:N-acetylglucosaminyl-diphospho-decaprenol L-rhamnosyltransferase